MNEQTSHSGNYGFLAGLVAGTVVGAGVALWLTPSATAEVRDRLSKSARRIGEDVRSRGEGIRDQVADVVARGAHDLEQFAVAGKTDRRSL